MPGPDDRAASEVIGAIILFGFLVITFAIYQGVVVPDQNRGIEFEHNQAVQESIQDLRNAIRQTASTAAEESVSITLGPTYPQRILAINPGSGAGTIRTQSLEPITIQNVSATHGETADYFGPSNPQLGGFESNAVIYTPIYFQYRQAPSTHYENTLAFNQFPGGTNLTITNQAIINNRKITLIALEGNLSEARQGTVTVDTKALSTATNTVSVTDESGPINITFGTQLTAADWNETLEDELTSNGGHVTDVRQTGSNQVSIILDPGTYDLSLAKVGVGTGTTAEGPKYIVDVEGDDTSVIENGTQKLVVEVRDRFNNPVSNVTVDAGTPSDGTLDTTTETTAADGQSTFVYTAPADVDGPTNVTINMSFAGDGTANESLTFNLKVLDADGSGDSGDGVSEVNPSGEDRLVLQESTEGTPRDRAQLHFNNTGTSTLTVTKLRVPFYFKDVDGHDVAEVVESFGGSNTFEGADSVSIGDPLTGLDDPVEFSPGESTVVIDFGTGTVRTGGDFFILVVQLENGATLTYFVAPQ